MEAMVAVRNLLAEGYRPFLSSDGTTLYFAQVSRSIEGGVSFTF
jgi:Fe-S cluster biogenesis protein NfuA